MAKMITIDGYTTSLWAMLDVLDERREQAEDEARCEAVEAFGWHYDYRDAGALCAPGLLACSPAKATADKAITLFRE